MAIQLIDKIKQKNNGSFFLVDAEDVEYDGKSLVEALKAGEIITSASGGFYVVEAVSGTTIPLVDFNGETPVKGGIVLAKTGDLYKITAVDDPNVTVESLGASMKGVDAGFGTLTATVDDKTGTPSVDASWDGPDTAKNLTLAFHNLKGDKGDKGDAFSISHVYTSVEEMNAGFATDGVAQGAFVIITTENPKDEDNGKVYVKGDSEYQFITDMSSEGIQGPAGTITISQTITGEAGTQASVVNNGTETAAQLVFTIPKGDKGEPGQRGATITVGNGAPSALEGMVANDLYIDADTGDLYQFGDAPAA